MQPYIPEYKDRLGQVLKTMQIIQSGYGIRTENEQQKLTKARAEQEQLKSDEMAKEQRRRSEGLFNQAEKDTLLTEGVGPSTPGATFGYVAEAKIDPDTNQRVLNPDGTPQTERKVFWYKPAGNIEGKAKESAASAAELKVKQDFARSKGIIPPEDLIDATKTSSYSFEKKPGWREGKTMVGGQEKAIWWIAPQDLAAENMASDNNRADQLFQRQKNSYDAQDKLNKLKLQDAERVSEENQRLYDNKTILSDIGSTQNATGLIPKQGPNVPLVLAPEFLPENRNKPGLIPGKPGQPATVYNEDPKKIERDREIISKRIGSEKIDSLAGALTKVDSLIGGIDGKSPIPGVGKVGKGIRALPLWGLEETGMTEREIEVKKAVAEVRDAVLNMRGGASVTSSELERLAEGLGMDKFSSNTALRFGLQNVRDRMKSVLKNIESGYSTQSLEAYRQNPNAIRSDSGVFGDRAGNKIQSVDPNLTPEDAMDDYFKGK